MIEAECRECKFWQRMGVSFGLCRRYAPRPILHMADPDWDELEEGIIDWHVPSYPVVYADSFCGEFAQKPKEPLE